MGALTPAMKQYMEVKNAHPDCVILFRMGDFYETFFEDAKTVAAALNITLTKRGKSEDGSKIPLAGIPYHALDNYLTKLIKQGYKVAICEQLEDPKYAKGIVKRGLTRIVTPGTIIEDSMLENKKNNFILSLYKEENKVGISAVDISTGVFLATETNLNGAIDEVAKYSPAEIIIPMSLEESNLAQELKSNKYCVNVHSDRHFVFEEAERSLLSHFQIKSLISFGLENNDNLIVSSAGALISYLYETQKTTIDYINSMKLYKNSEFMQLDNITIKNLELVGGITGNSTSLLSVIDKTKTSMGARMLRNWLLNPLLKVDDINYRLLSVSELTDNIVLRSEIREYLSGIADMERLVSRINYGNGSARDLNSLSCSLSLLPEIKNAVSKSKSNYLKNLSDMQDLTELNAILINSVKDEPSGLVREGNMIKSGYNSELDELHEIMHNSRKFIAEIEVREKERTGIKSLRIGFNNIFGYFFTVTNANLSQVPTEYIRKQTTVAGERFITQELKELEEKILGAEEKANELEYKIFCELVEKVRENTKELQDAAKALSELDCLCSLAEVAMQNNYKRPVVHEGYEIILKNSRHPVIEKIEKTFIPNDVNLLFDNRLMIITGPNMAGKSTFMRQVALNVILSQIGSFVPCESAKIGLVDRIFIRVGANDDITHGQSTFMVEMNEVSNIMNNATSKSLIIMDEIGRGTSTFDGVAIAWSVAEYISKLKAKTLFATHYHVLTELEGKYDGVKNYNTSVREDNDNIVFLRKIILGGTDKSYGIHVARLAGMPKSAVLRAKEIQEMLSTRDEMKKKINGIPKKIEKTTGLNEWF